MANAVGILTQAVQHLRNGHLDKAGSLYEQILQTNPEDPNVLHALSLIAFQTDQYETAVKLMHRAVSMSSKVAEFQNTYGAALAALNRLPEAVAAYRQAIRLKPAYTEAYNNLALAMHAQGQTAEAMNTLKTAIHLHPNAAVSFYNLANLLRDQGHDDEAIEQYQKAIHLDPDLIQAHVNLAALLHRNGRPAEAAAAYQYAIALMPQAADLHRDLGTALKDCGEYDEAVTAFQEAIRLNPNDARIHNGLGVALKEAGRCREAIASYDRALQLKPDDTDTRWNRCLALLLQGDYTRGWVRYQRYYEALHTRRYVADCRTPLWDGSPFVNQRLYIRYHQGLGDNLQFIRYLPQVKALGGTVIYEAKSSLIPLLKNVKCIDQLVEAAPDGVPAVDHDYHICLMDLPRIFGTTLDTVPHEVPYLFADPERSLVWSQHVSGPGLKVGLVWAGGASHRNDRNRSCPLVYFAPLAEMTNVELFGLQTGPRAKEADRGRVPIINLGPYFQDFADTAAVIAHLDLVISVDTAVLHLAGAMGKPTWALLPFAPDWRWLLHRRDSPWYPTLRLFRQNRPGQWKPVLEGVAQELNQYQPAAADLSKPSVKGIISHDSHSANSRGRDTAPQ